MNTKYAQILIFSAALLKTAHTLFSKLAIYCKLFIKDFFKCGILGWCMEILFTAWHAFRRRDLRLIGHTSLWMFPIYGCACCIRPLAALFKKKSVLTRGLIYTIGFFLVEFFTGSILTQKNACPWNYCKTKWQIHEVIRLDFTPLWFLTGLLYEQILTKKKDCSK